MYIYIYKRMETGSNGVDQQKRTKSPYRPLTYCTGKTYDST